MAVFLIKLAVLKILQKENYTSVIIAIYEFQDIRPLLDLYVFSYLRTCSLYDSTIKALGFDEIRVRYRHIRREMLRYIIEHELVKSKMTDFINAQIQKLIPKKDKEAFLEDIFEDIEQIDVNRIAGLGITPEQLKKWLKLNGGIRRDRRRCGLY